MTAAIRRNVLLLSMGITEESLTRANPSVQQNPVPAEIFHRAGLIEKWGRVTKRAAGTDGGEWTVERLAEMR